MDILATAMQGLLRWEVNSFIIWILDNDFSFLKLWKRYQVHILLSIQWKIMSKIICVKDHVPILQKHELAYRRQMDVLARKNHNWFRWYTKINIISAEMRHSLRTVELKRVSIQGKKGSIWCFFPKNTLIYRNSCCPGFSLTAIDGEAACGPQVN